MVFFRWKRTVSRFSFLCVQRGNALVSGDRRRPCSARAPLFFGNCGLSGTVAFRELLSCGNCGLWGTLTSQAPLGLQEPLPAAGRAMMEPCCVSMEPLEKSGCGKAVQLFLCVVMPHPVKYADAGFHCSLFHLKLFFTFSNFSIDLSWRGEHTENTSSRCLKCFLPATRQTRVDLRKYPGSISVSLNEAGAPYFCLQFERGRASLGTFGKGPCFSGFRGGFPADHNLQGE